MRKWKCVKSNDEKRWTVGKVYTTDKDGRGLCADNGDANGWNRPWHFVGVIFEEVNRFTKEDLKPCMVVRTREGRIYMVAETMRGICAVESGGCYIDFDMICDDLTHEICKQFDIVEVYGFSKLFADSQKINILQMDLIWKREEKSEVQIEIESIEAEQKILSEKNKQLADRLKKIKGEL